MELGIDELFRCGLAEYEGHVHADRQHVQRRLLAQAGEVCVRHGTLQVQWGSRLHEMPLDKFLKRTDFLFLQGTNCS